jgi:hypothetical protein
VDLECHFKHQSYTIPIGCGEVEIVESAYILNAEELEDIIYQPKIPRMGDLDPLPYNLLGNPSA